MEQGIKRFLAIVAVAALLSACSDGDGGGSSSSQVAVSGVASQSSGPGATAGKVAKQAEVSVLAGADVTILSYDTAGVLKETVKATTGPNGAFNASVNALKGGGTLNVKVQAANSIVYEKSYPYKNAAELSAGLQVDAVLDPVAIEVVPAGDSVDFDKSAMASDMLSVAVVKTAQGAKKIVSNSKIGAAKAAGGQVTWQLDVAKSLLAAAGATELTVKAQNYNPAIPDDMSRFPATSTDTGERLISASFDFIDIKDQNGNPLVITKAAAAKARKSTAVAYAVRKLIPDCNLILKDENANKPGVQIGFFFMRNGTWQKLGEATLYDSIGSPTTDPVLHVLGSCTSGSLPYAVLTDADVSSDINFDLKWFNFDYVAFGDIKSACVEGSVNLKKADDSIVPLGGINLNLYDLKQGSPAAAVSGFQSAYAYSKGDGKYRFDFTYSADALANPTAILAFNEPDTWQQSTRNVTLAGPVNANGCYDIAAITIEEPKCSVAGTLLKSDSTPAAGRSVNIYQTGAYSGSRWTSTDNSGNYTLPAVCSVDYTLNADGMMRVFNVSDGTVGSDELTDSNNKVTMKNITKANNPPTAYISADNTSVKVTDSVNLYGYGYDPDNDVLTYVWTTSCGVYTPAAGSNNQTIKWTAPATAPASSLCTLTLTVSDGSLSGTATSDIFVSTTGNRPPVITYLYAPTALTAGRSAELLVNAYDANADSLLSYSWSSTCGALSGATTTEPSFTAPASGPCDVTVTVTDNADPPLSATKTASINVNPNQPPTITSFAVSPAAVALNGTATLNGSAFDINGDDLTWNWSIVSGGGTLAATGCSGSGSGSVPTSTCTYTAPNAAATVILRYTVDDGVNPAVTRDKSVSVSNASGSTTIVVQ